MVMILLAKGISSLSSSSSSSSNSMEIMVRGLGFSDAADVGVVGMGGRCDRAELGVDGIIEGRCDVGVVGCGGRKDEDPTLCCCCCCIIMDA